MLRATPRGCSSRVVLLAALCAHVVAATPARAGDQTAAEPGASSPLGSFETPVRCDMPSGEREYLRRLRCPDGAPPEIHGRASYGRGPYGNVLDGYEVECSGRGKQHIFMDMYHRRHREMESVPGFTLLPDLPARAAAGCPPVVPGATPGTYVFDALEVDFPARPPRDWMEVEGAAIKGDVVVQLVVLPSGRADRDSIEISRTDDEALRALARERVENTRFQAAEHRHGCRVPQAMEIGIRYR
jgi:hypothetical protein